MFPSTVRTIYNKLETAVFGNSQKNFVWKHYHKRKMSSVQEAREKFLSMSTEEKRQFYGKKQFTVVSDIEAWDLFFQNNKDRLKQQFSSTYSGSKKPPILEKFEVNPTLNSKVCLWRGDITLLEIDAIVNAANNKMLGGGGVDGAIHRAAGSQLFDECKTLHGCETGSAKITAGYKLPARYVIHTVGPRGEIPNKLQSCYETCLRLLLENQLRSVAFPCISTGIYGYPQESAANVALHTVRKFLEKKSTLVDRVVFCLFLEEDVKIYENLMQLYFPVE